MTTIENKILGHEEIGHKIRRIAYQIYETFVDEEEIVIAGIVSGGLTFAEKIAGVFSEISDIPVTLCEVRIDKNTPTNPVSTSLSEDAYRHKAVVLVDDVLNSGSTLIYGIRHFLNVPLKKLKTTVLVDRNHKRYPVKADFKGISLSTSLQEHVSVEFSDNGNAVYLR
ncbi:phosphoribosyltransferase family protein [Sinomicrobium soli]|uniref:phosphoribosyltransferase family protein n=1 Tax=Sinomicrobium sp. N-1-3-6 TaxID=2219864 RepID=UPI000DCE4E36|nr:phosphoribosyltransferase family protein [Sinomicrobium sp. N-1-3-6]RAV27659.1 phosphoribosyltransferase [Sinomicrobium sp. N-1-3-6]